jgi:hypothetical protein
VSAPRIPIVAASVAISVAVSTRRISNLRKVQGF